VGDEQRRRSHFNRNNCAPPCGGYMVSVYVYMITGRYWDSVAAPYEGWILGQGLQQVLGDPRGTQ